MSVILGIVLAGLLFGLSTLLRARDRGGCTGGCAGCTGQGHCATTDEATNAVSHGVKS
ncbi:MAG TPA: FeoB-associated Cys-rich membrane protein [Gemmatimonadaceae bacterium]